MSEPILLVSEPRDGIQVLVLNRPKAANALVFPLLSAIIDALKAAATNDAVKLVIITGKGRFFSAGADVAAIAGSAKQPSGVESLIEGLRNNSVALTETLIHFPKVVVAAVNGPAVGYAAGFLGLFDMVLVSEAGSFQAPFLHLGLCPEGGSSYAVARAVGPKRFTEWLLSGRAVRAKEMLSSGLACGRLYPADSFLDNVVADLTRGVKATPMSSILVSKKLLRAPDLEELRRTNEREFDGLAKQFREGSVFKRFAAVMMGLERKKSKL